jgi:signal transduction histidine kinase
MVDRAGVERLVRHGGALVVAVLVGLVAFGLIVDEDPTPPSHASLVLDERLALLACLVLFWRRRWPVQLALAVLVISFFSAGAMGAAAVLIYTVAAERRTQVSVPIGLAFILLSPLSQLARARTDLAYQDGPGLALALLVAVALAWGLFVRARRELIGRSIADARRMERARIAREMHDVLGHRLSLVSMHAGALEYRADIPGEQRAVMAGIVRENAHQALEDLRDVIGVLRDEDDGDAVRPQPVLADLPALVDESREAGLRVRTDYRLADLAAVPATTGRTAYRITQEGLTNARKHAVGDDVDLVVDGVAGDRVTIELRNRTATGLVSAIPGAGTGLVGMTERVTLAGGGLEHGRTQDGDFRLFVWLPWRT